ncbi:MAG: BrnT family toxin [Pyrinomonadaceae bacterium]|nr:BrnT family toxin [Pyrinomonadaceae bacterium]
MRFDWDKNEAASNLAKHQVSFEEAATVFGDPLSDTFDDPDHSAEERRFLIIGHSENGRLLFVSHTDDCETVRIISAREPTHGERDSYEQG